MSRTATCAHCGQPISSGDRVSFRSKNFHSACLPDYKAQLVQSAKEKDAKKSAAIKKANIFDPELDRLTKYLLCHFELEQLTPLLSKQLQEFRQQRGYSYRDIYLAVRYFFELCPDGEYEERVPTIGIVPYVIEEAKEFWELANEANEFNRNKPLENSTVYLKYESKPAPLHCPFKMEDV